MPTAYQIVEQDKAHFLTLQIVEWVDVFTRKIYRDIVIDSLKYCIAKKGLEVFAYVIMSNHIHLIARSNVSNLSRTIRDFKKFTARSILDYAINNNESRRCWASWILIHPNLL